MTFVHRSWRLGLVASLALFAIVAVTPVLAATGAVSIVNRTFEPATIEIAEGDTVTWTVTTANGEPHTVTSAAGDGGVAQGAVFNSQTDDPDLTKLKEEGGTFSFTFEEAGTYAYLCTVHATEMTGTVEVRAAGEGGEPHPPVPAERKLAGAAILAVTLVVLFAAAWFWRRMNPA